MSLNERNALLDRCTRAARRAFRGHAATPAKKIASLNHKYDNLHSRCGVVGPNQIKQILFAAVEETEEVFPSRHPTERSAGTRRIRPDRRRAYRSHDGVVERRGGRGGGRREPGMASSSVKR